MLFLYIPILFCLLMVLIALYAMYDYHKKTYGFLVYSKKYKRSQRFIYRNGEFRPEYILNGEKMEDWLNEI